MAPLKILITGATGYIGGSVLTGLLDSNDFGSKYTISALVRGEDKATVLESKGVTPILFEDLDQSDVLQKAASEHDVVIQMAIGFHIGSPRDLILGLAERKKQTGKEVHYIHTSGTSNLADQPITGKYHEERIFSDKENIYAYEKSREALQPYPQRTAELTVVDTGLKVGVQTHVIMSPTIYGIGTGPFHTLSIQFPAIIRSAIKTGQVETIGEGKGIWDYVHIADLVTLYTLLVSKIVAGEALPSGEQGILFSATGRYTWGEAAEYIGKALFDLGAIKTPEVRHISLEEAAEKWSGGQLLLAELGFASNSRTTSVVGRELGWNPVKTEADFKSSFQEDAKLIVAEGN